MWWRWAVVAMLAGGQCGCLTQQTVRTKSSTITFRGHEDDTKKIRSKFGGGYSYGPNGEVITDRKNPFDTEKKMADSNREASTKVFRGLKKDYAGKDYKTPDYLMRNKDFRGKKAWGADEAARESDIDRHLASGANTEARTQEAKGLDRLFRTRSASGLNRDFATRDVGEFARAQDGAPVPQPGPGPSAENNYQVEKRVTMDEVRQLLHPGQGGGS